MARKRVSKTSKVDEIVSNAKFSKWCEVNTENVFTFEGNDYKIDTSLEQYVVLNKPRRNEDGTFNNWTNDSAMEKVLCADDGGEIVFFDEKLTNITESVYPAKYA